MEGKGLQILTPDARDYSHHAKFGTLGAPALPTQDFTVYDSFQYVIKKGDTLSVLASKFGNTFDELVNENKIENRDKIYVGQVITVPARTIPILNQFDLDFCTAFATTELQYLIFGMQFDPLYQMAKIEQIIGSFAGYGANLRDAAKSVLQFGSLPKKLAPYTHDGSQTDKGRDFLANWNNYPRNFDTFAAKYKDLSYFTIDGTGDAFDNIRSALYIHRQERQAVTFGLNWHPEWTYAPGGIIQDIIPTSEGEGHDMAIVGQRSIGSIEYLILQQSWSDKMGDKGLYYFPRSVINNAYSIGYGAYIFSRNDGSGLKGSLFDSLLGFLKSFLNV